MTPVGMPLPPATNNNFSSQFTQTVANGLDDFVDAGLFRGDGDLNFERDFGQWFNPDDLSFGAQPARRRSRSSRHTPAPATVVLPAPSSAPAPQMVYVPGSRSHSRSTCSYSRQSRHSRSPPPPIVIQACSRSSSRSRSPIVLDPRIPAMTQPMPSVVHSARRSRVRRRARQRQYSPSTESSSSSRDAPPVIISSGMPPPPPSWAQPPPPQQPWEMWGQPANPAHNNPGFSAIPAHNAGYSVPLFNNLNAPNNNALHNTYPGFVPPPSNAVHSTFPPPPTPPRQGWGPAVNAGAPPPPWASSPVQAWGREAQRNQWSNLYEDDEFYEPLSWFGGNKHSRFWYPDGNVTIVVENTGYRLHRYLFQKSVWAWNFNTNASCGQHAYLHSVNKKDFERFLTILYPLEYGKHECQTAEEWASVLAVADNAKMDDIRRLAIGQLAACAGPVDKIALGHRYDVKDWLGPAYLALAMRKEPISAAEGVKLGVEALVRVAALKDEVFANLTTYVDQGKFAELFGKLAV